jgi:ABC-type multidrug transport system fused ATPase/permease subunit
MNLPKSLVSTEVSCWILTGERQTAVIRSKYVQVLLNQDMSFFDTYGNNGDIVSQVLSDVLLIQSALSEKVRSRAQPPSLPFMLF